MVKMIEKGSAVRVASGKTIREGRVELSGRKLCLVKGSGFEAGGEWVRTERCEVLT